MLQIRTKYVNTYRRKILGIFINSGQLYLFMEMCNQHILPMKACCSLCQLTMDNVRKKSKYSSRSPPHQKKKKNPGALSPEQRKNVFSRLWFTFSLFRGCEAYTLFSFFLNFFPCPFSLQLIKSKTFQVFHRYDLPVYMLATFLEFVIIKSVKNNSF